MTPPKFAPHTPSIVTLYEVMEEAAINRHWITPPDEVRFLRDIYPIFQRIVNLQWVNASSYRGHSPGTRGDLTNPTLLPHLADDGPESAALRRRVFERIRNPHLPEVAPPGDDPAEQEAFD